MSIRIYPVLKTLYRLEHNEEVKDIYLDGGGIDINKSDELTNIERRQFDKYFNSVKKESRKK